MYMIIGLIIGVFVCLILCYFYFREENKLQDPRVSQEEKDRILFYRNLSMLC